jgi:hypothetical protein
VTLDDFAEFSAVVIGFGELRGKTLSPAAIELYFRSMASWSLPEFKTAAEHLLRTCEWMPTPFHFEELRKAGRPVPAEAWLAAREIAKTWRANASAPRSGVELVDRVVASIGGYRAIAMCNTDALGFLEKRFVDAYESMQDAWDTRESVPELTSSGSAMRLIGPRKLSDGMQRLLPQAVKP